MFLGNIGYRLYGIFNSMNVLRLFSPRDLRIISAPIPQPTAGELQVRMTAVAVCGSDLHWFTEGGIGTVHVKEGRPVLLGHEMAGVIASGERQGQRVAVDPAIPCGVCEFCQEGNPNFCLNLRFAGDGNFDGGFCEYVTWQERCLHPLPNSVSDAEGALLEPLGIALHSVDLAHLRTGMRVGVFGCGMIGLLIVQLARLSGAVQIIATDPLPHRLEAARSFGATDTLLAQPGSVEIPAVWAVSGQRGVHAAFEAAGENDAVETACAAARPGGKVILVGIPAVDHITFTASTARRKGLTLKLVRRMKNTYPRAISLVDKGKVDLLSLITQRYPLVQASQAFEVASQRSGIKVVVDI
jgi:L-iditol 2-dehydrogenase